MPVDTTLDGILNRRVLIEQPAKGFRVAVDTVLLAAAVPARGGQRALEIGCGVGGAMLALAWMVPGLRIDGIDLQPDLIALCEGNIARNAVQDRVTAACRNVATLEVAGIYDHVLMNPPYHDAARHDVSADPSKRRANADAAGELSVWIAQAARALASDGVLTLIHRADRRAEIEGLLQAQGWVAACLPILPKAGAAPKRILIRAARDLRFLPPWGRPELVLHTAEGRFTPEADALLRDGKALAGANEA